MHIIDPMCEMEMVAPVTAEVPFDEYEEDTSLFDSRQPVEMKVPPAPLYS